MCFKKINKLSLSIYLITITISLSVIFYTKLYNEIILGSIKNEFEQYIDKGIDVKTELDNKTIKSDNLALQIILCVFLGIFIVAFFFDVYDNIKFTNKEKKNRRKFIMFGAIILFPLFIIIRNNISLEDNNKIYVNELFKHKNKENINNGFGIIIGIILCYHIILSLISKGVLPVNLSMHNDFIFTEKIYLLFLVVLLCCSLIIAVKKKISITQEIIEKINNDYNKTKATASDDSNPSKDAQNKINNFFKKDSNEYFRINNNYLLNVFYSIFALILCIYFYINHFKETKYDLVNGLLVNNSSWVKKILSCFKDLNIIALVIILIIIGFVPYSN